MSYKKVYDSFKNDPEGFWKEQADLIPWFKKPTQILRETDHGSHEWFVDGELNTCHVALDHHVQNGRGDQAAVIYDSPATGVKQSITYGEMLRKVSLFAGAMKRAGIRKGDRVIIYMPMIPEALIAIYACARIGAVHSVVFGGFAPHELSVRIDDAEAKMLITASCGIEFNKKIAYKPLVDEALRLSKKTVETVVVRQRDALPAELTPGTDREWEEFQEGAEEAEAVPLKATDPLYVLYTSGTTGKPKGVVRQNGGHAVALKYSMDAIYRTRPGEVYWAASDIGWIVGHSYIVYAPLIQGCATLVYEGKPVRTPDAGAFWRVISEHSVSTFFTAPTAFRAIKKEDPDASLLKQHDISCLRGVYVAGERLDPPTYEWLKEKLDQPLIDHWWQTETAWAISSLPMGIEELPPRIGSSGFPMPGFQVEIKDDEGKTLEPNEKGNIVIKLPLPPCCFHTLWNDAKKYRESYLDAYEGYYLTGDGGYFDEDGYLYVMGRIDDTINVAGHRLSTGEMEELVGEHPAVAECAVVGIHDEYRGQVPVGFVVFKDGITQDAESVQAEIVAKIRNDIGAFACFKSALEVKRLPKTRSGKILRKTIRRLAEEENVEVPNTIDDPAILGEIKAEMQKVGVGRWAG